jgi:FkbM family methyltransferase
MEFKWTINIESVLSGSLWTGRRVCREPDLQPAEDMNSLLAYLYRHKEKVLPNVELSKFPPIRRFRSWVRKRMRRESVEIGGHKLFLDPNDSLDLSIEPVYEPELTAAIQRETKPGNVVADVGANIGYYTLILARCVGPEGRVFAFEPDPVNFALLQRNIEVNGYRNVVAVNKAVSDRAGPTRLFLAPDNLADHRIFDPGDGRRSIPVETLVLDSLLKKGKLNNARHLDLMCKRC